MLSEAAIRIGLVLGWVIGIVMLATGLRGLARFLGRHRPAIGGDDEDMPDGCLNCNPRVIRTAMIARNVDPAAFTLCPPTRKGWPDVSPPCDLCGAQFLIDHDHMYILHRNKQ